MDNQPEEKSNITPAPPNKRLQQTQAKVDEVVDIMRINVDKVLERDKNLSKLDNRADALQAGASQFEASAGKLKRKFWWRNCKILLALAVLMTILIIVTITWIVSSQKNAKIIEKLNAGLMNSEVIVNSSNATLDGSTTIRPISEVHNPSLPTTEVNESHLEKIPDV